MAREYGTDPYGILARGAPSGDSAGRGIGGSGLSVGTVGVPMADISRAPGNTVGTGRGITFSTSFGGSPGGGVMFTNKDTAGAVKKRAKGGKADGEPTGGKKVSKAKRYATGGKVSSASKRADGCATKGKTRGKIV
jgi:hypothetical protein